MSSHPGQVKECIRCHKFEQNTVKSHGFEMHVPHADPLWREGRCGKGTEWHRSEAQGYSSVTEGISLLTKTQYKTKLVLLQALIYWDKTIASFRCAQTLAYMLTYLKLDLESNRVNSLCLVRHQPHKSQLVMYVAPLSIAGVSFSWCLWGKAFSQILQSLMNINSRKEIEQIIKLLSLIHALWRQRV